MSRRRAQIRRRPGHRLRRLGRLPQRRPGRHHRPGRHQWCSPNRHCRHCRCCRCSHRRSRRPRPDRRHFPGHRAGHSCCWAGSADCSTAACTCSVAAVRLAARDCDILERYGAPSIDEKCPTEPSGAGAARSLASRPTCPAVGNRQIAKDNRAAADKEGPHIATCVGAAIISVSADAKAVSNKRHAALNVRELPGEPDTGGQRDRIAAGSIWPR
jgi:hypothetical protein